MYKHRQIEKYNHVLISKTRGGQAKAAKIYSLGMLVFSIILLMHK